MPTKTPDAFAPTNGRAARFDDAAADHLAAVQGKFVTTRREMAAALIERDAEVDVVLTGLIANHHPLLVGEPGTAKSLLSRTVAEWLDGNQFEVLLNKFTDPSEVFGPISIEGLKRDEYRRITDGTLVEAEVAFLDEIFKASTAILNATLGILNERRFRNGKSIAACPLVMAVAASNEWPQDNEAGGRELGALFDRFLLRRTVQPVRSREGEERLLWDADLTPRLSTRITVAEIAVARERAAALPFGDDAKEAFGTILRELAAEGIVPGDRRKRWSVGAVRAFAYLSGAAAVERDHLEVLAHCLWIDPREQPVKAAGVVARIANPSGMEITGYLHEAREIVAAVDRRSLTSCGEATGKLDNIARRLAKMGTSKPRVAEALEHVQAKAKELRIHAVTSGMV